MDTAAGVDAALAALSIQEGAPSAAEYADQGVPLVVHTDDASPAFGETNTPPMGVIQPVNIASISPSPSATSGPKFCHECGKKWEPGNKFCSECGTKNMNFGDRNGSPNQAPAMQVSQPAQISVMQPSPIFISGPMPIKNTVQSPSPKWHIVDSNKLLIFQHSIGGFGSGIRNEVPPPLAKESITLAEWQEWIDEIHDLTVNNVFRKGCCLKFYVQCLTCISRVIWPLFLILICWCLCPECLAQCCLCFLTPGYRAYQNRNKRIAADMNATLRPLGMFACNVYRPPLHPSHVDRSAGGTENDVGYLLIALDKSESVLWEAKGKGLFINSMVESCPTS